MRDEQRADGVFSHNSAGVADDICVAGAKPKGFFQRDAVIHAGDHRQLVGDGRGRPRRVVSFGKRGIGRQYFV